MTAHEIKQQILSQTENGLTVFQHYIPDLPSDTRKAFKIRDEKTPSAHLKEYASGWVITDFGDTEEGTNCFDYICKEYSLSFIQACRKIAADLGLLIDFGTAPKEYKRPATIASGTFAEKQVAYLEKRGFDIAQVYNKGVQATTHYFPSAKQELPCFAIPFYEEGTIVNYKYIGYTQDADGRVRKHISNTADAKRTFYNIDSVQAGKPVCVVEGEWDCISVIQALAGGPACLQDIAVVSVPNGVHSLNSASDCLEKVQKASEVYLFVDGDEPGLKLQQELARRIGKEKCKIVLKYGFKDANDMLKKAGEDLIINAIRQAEFLPIDGLVNLSAIEDEFFHFFENGFGGGDSVGYPKFDKLLNFETSQFTVITGVPGHGKSVFCDQIFVRLAIQHGWKFAVYSPEFGKIHYHIAQLMQQITGKIIPYKAKAYREKKGLTVAESQIISKDEMRQAYSFIEKHFFMFELKEPTVQNIHDSFRGIVARHGVKGCIVDPFNRITDVSAGADKMQAINSYLTQVNQLKKELDIHYFLIAHPRKMQTKTIGGENGETVSIPETPSVYDIAHSSDFYNQVDNALTVYRNPDNSVRVYVQKVKMQHNGSLGSSEFNFDINSNTYTEQGDSQAVSNKEYKQQATTSTGDGIAERQEIETHERSSYVQPVQVDMAKAASDFEQEYPSQPDSKEMLF